MISPLSISISTLGHCFLPYTFILTHFTEFNESFLSEEWLLCITNITFANRHLFPWVIKKSRMCRGFLKVFLLWDKIAANLVILKKKKRQHWFGVQIYVYGCVSCSGDKILWWAVNPFITRTRKILIKMTPSHCCTRPEQNEKKVKKC